jgi:hypothetical protein
MYEVLDDSRLLVLFFSYSCPGMESWHREWFLFAR